MRFLKIGVAVAAMATAGLAVAAPAQASATEADSTWLAAAHQSNLAEIAAGTDAQANATNAGIKELGQMLVADHTKLDGTVRQLAEKYDVDLPDAPNAEQRAALAETKQNSGEAYDAAWTRTQTEGHLKTKARTASYLSQGGANDVEAAARAATPVVQMHIDELKSIAGDLGIDVPSSVAGGTGGQTAAGGFGLTGALLLGGGLGLLAAAAALLRRRTARV